MQPLQEKLLVTKAKLGDMLAFTTLVEHYEAPLMRFLYRLGAGDNADDILQETCVKIWKNLQGYNFNFPFGAWVYRIARNEAWSYYRKEKKHQETLELNEEVYQMSDEASADFVADFDGEIQKKVVFAAISKLKPKYREVIVLYYFEGKGYKEIADILKEATSSIGTKIRRAKQALKPLLEQENQKLKTL